MRVRFTNEVYVTDVKLRLTFNHASAEIVCVYAGQTASDSLGCINMHEYGELLNEHFVAFDADMLPTRELLIEFNGVAYLDVLELNYYSTIITTTATTTTSGTYHCHLLSGKVYSNM